MNKIRENSAWKIVSVCILLTILISLLPSYFSNRNIYALDKNTFPMYLQGDSAWGSKTIPGAGSMKNYGCAINCSAMVAKYYGCQTDPGTLLNYLTGHSGITSEGKLDWQSVVNSGNGILTSYKRVSYSGLADMTAVNSMIDSGKPVILEVRCKLSSGAFSQHFVVCTSREGNTYYINDPLSGRTTLDKYYYWDGGAARAIYGYCVFYASSNGNGTNSSPNTSSTATTTATTATTPQNSGKKYQIKYYANDNLNGNIVMTAESDNISFNWGSNGPGSPCGNDYFSCEMVGTEYFDATGYYAINWKSDDKIKIYIDGNCILDIWSAQNGSGCVIQQISKGNHEIKVKYAEMTGEALLSVSFQQTNAPTPTPVPAIPTTIPTATTPISTIPSPVASVTPTPNTASGNTSTTVPAATGRNMTEQQEIDTIVNSYEICFFAEPAQAQIDEWRANPYWLTIEDLVREHTAYINEHTISGFDEGQAKTQFIALFERILGYTPDAKAINWNVLQIRLGILTLPDIEKLIIAGIPSSSGSTGGSTPVGNTQGTDLTMEVRRSMIISSYKKTLYREPSEYEINEWLQDPWWMTENELIDCHNKYIADHTIANFDEAATRQAIVDAFVCYLGYQPSEYDLAYNVIAVKIGYLTVDKIIVILQQ